MAGVFLKVTVQCHGLIHHLAVNHRGVEQVQSVGMPHGKAKVGYVKAPLLLTMAIMSPSFITPRNKAAFATDDFGM